MKDEIIVFIFDLILLFMIVLIGISIFRLV